MYLAAEIFLNLFQKDIEKKMFDIYIYIFMGVSENTFLGIAS